MVPLAPKELTPAQRACPSGQGVRPTGTARPRPARSTWGDGVWKWRLAGISPRWTTNAALINPAIPAAASRWPTLVLIDPTQSGAPGGRPAPWVSASAIARASIGSPRGVPVPWAST
ncbi:MAG: hypothetical protein R3B09_34815 [Nannocystaceae bacterium]